MVEIPADSADILYEQADEVPGFGAVLFVTAVTTDVKRGRVVRESHVFVPRENLHRHDIVCGAATRDDAAVALADGVRATHGLFAALVGARGQDQERAARHGLAYATRRLDEHPFHDFRLRNLFRDQLWEIQDWTVTPALREALAQVTRYRAEPDEAALLSRIFAGDLAA